MSKVVFSFFNITILILLTTACSSSLKRGRDNYENKNYVAALSEFESALEEDPKDAQAKEFLRKIKLIDDWTTHIEISKPDFVDKLSAITEERDIGLFSDVFI